mgnify:CR=1 FL=1
MLTSCLPVDFVIEANGSLTEECEPTTVDTAVPPVPAVTGRSDSAQVDFPYYEPPLASPIAIAHTPQSANAVQTPPGSRSSQLSAYSHAHYSDLAFEMRESSVSARRVFPSTSPPITPNIPSPMTYIGSHSDNNDARRRSSALSPRLAHGQALLAPREAYLLRYYIDRIAPWVSYLLPEGLLSLIQSTVRRL